MNYEEMSDFEINGEVAKASGLDVQYQSMRNDGMVLVVVKIDCGVERYYRVPDYCGSWDDAGPVIFDNLICLVSPVIPRDEWVATWSSDGGMWSVNDFTCRHKNPLRAAMIVFLMMNGAEK